ncbi:MAG: sulfurtransferase-like selenium metabolism protein YedF [Firmicutes bacterium]|nr:sulfurtransferase-like selenium metabolism protein YedF [Bacillota bacterium]
MEKTVDARGLACPRPVVLTKKVLDEGEAESVLTIVDNPTAVENVSRLVRSLGCDFQVEEKEGVYHIRISRPTSGIGKPGPAEGLNLTGVSEQLMENVPGSLVFMVVSNRFGKGEDELGRVLMKSFFFTLTQLDVSIKSIIFINSGVFLSTEGSEVAGSLAELEAAGVEVLSCGTCLDYYGLKEKLLVGRVSNMYTIMETVSAAGKAITVG